MAAKFTTGEVFQFPGATRSGRRVQPSAKMKEALVDTAEDDYLNAANTFREQRKVVLTMMNCQSDYSTFNVVYQDWLLMWVDVKEAENKLSRLYSKDEWDKRSKQCSLLHADYELTKAEALRYIERITKKVTVDLNPVTVPLSIDKKKHTLNVSTSTSPDLFQSQEVIGDTVYMSKADELTLNEHMSALKKQVNTLKEELAAARREMSHYSSMLTSTPLIAAGKFVSTPSTISSETKPIATKKHDDAEDRVDAGKPTRGGIVDMSSLLFDNLLEPVIGQNILAPPTDTTIKPPNVNPFLSELETRPLLERRRRYTVQQPPSYAPKVMFDSNVRTSSFERYNTELSGADGILNHDYNKMLSSQRFSLSKPSEYITQPTVTSSYGRPVPSVNPKLPVSVPGVIAGQGAIPKYSKYSAEATDLLKDQGKEPEVYRAVGQTKVDKMHESIPTSKDGPVGFDEPNVYEPRDSAVVSVDLEGSEVSDTPVVSSVSPGKKNENTSEISVLNKLADVLLSKKSDRLPAIEPSKFSGDVMAFAAWWSSFQNLVEDKYESDKERLSYLARYCIDEAYDAIRPYVESKYNKLSYKQAKQALRETFGDKMKIAEAYRTKLKNWPVIKKNDSKGLRRYVNFLKQLGSAMNYVGYLSSMREPENNKMLSSKLPEHLAVRWYRNVCKRSSPLSTTISLDEDSSDDNDSPYPSFEEFCEFLEMEVRICDATSDMTEKPKRVDKISLFTAAEPSVRPNQPELVPLDSPLRKPKCFFCKKNHCVDECEEFLAKTKDEKKAFAVKCGLCFGCLRRRHRYEDCKFRNPLLLRDGGPKAASAPSSALVNATSLLCSTHFSTILPVYVCHISDPENLVKTYAMVDGGSDSCFIRDNVADFLGLSGPEVDLGLITLADHSNVRSQVIFGLKVRGVSESVFVDVPKTYTTDDIPANRASIPRPETVRKWDHLQPIADYIHPYEEHLPVGILLGYNCFDALRGGETIDVGLRKPFAKKTPLGWAVTGPITEADVDDFSHVCFATMVKENPVHAIRQAFDVGFGGEDTSRKVSYDDQRFLKMMDDNVCFDADGHVQLPLPVREEVGPLPPSRNTALKRLLSQKPRLLRDPEMLQQYGQFFDNMLINDHAELVTGKPVMMEYEVEVTDEEVSNEDVLPESLIMVNVENVADVNVEDSTGQSLDSSKVDQSDGDTICKQKKRRTMKRKLKNVSAYRVGVKNKKKVTTSSKKLARTARRTKKVIKRCPRCWYLPHHGVYHPRKPKDLRVVFDGACEICGVSLNTILMPGPDMTNNLVGVLCRFREEFSAFICDIKKMFYQVRIQPDFRDYGRFFWFEKNDPNGRILEYRVTVHLFGACSSPACATYALRHVAETYKDKFGQEACDFVKKNFYVDDGLKSKKNTSQALDLIKAGKELCAEGKFQLDRFASNDKDVMLALPAEMRSKETKDWDPSRPLPMIYALGKLWDLETDTFRYKVKEMFNAKTRREMLSALGALYDPLGLISPVILKGRLILQELCRECYDWDEDVPIHLIHNWNEWYQELQNLAELAVPRCFRKTILDPVLVELHVFGDSCLQSYGCVAYVALEDELQHRDVSLVMAKSRVAPLKQITLPRLELQASVLATQVMEFLIIELPYDNIFVFMYTDSGIVMGYIGNDSKRFCIYIANRTQYIKDRTQLRQWRYVASADNPADIASRGITAAEIIGNQFWWEGPSFIKDNCYSYPEQQFTVAPNDPELKCNTKRREQQNAVCSTVIVQNTIENVLTQSLYVKPVFGPERPPIVLSTNTQESLINTEKEQCFPTMKQYFERVSTWSRLVKIVAVMKRYMRCCREKAQGKKKSVYKFPVNVTEKYKAKLTIVRLIQKEAFPVEFKKLSLEPEYPEDKYDCDRRKKFVGYKSNLIKLDVYMCPYDNVLRVGGRISRADLPKENIHPILLPKFHDVTKKVARYAHCISAHGGRQSTIGILRSEGWWIVSTRKVVDYVLQDCVTCKKLRGPRLTQKMADLPKERVEPSEPFTHSGVDFFGPFMIKEKRTMKKRWGCLFTCLAVRAVHIEVCPDMSTDSFINACRRFERRRGPIRTLRCDRGSNLMGAKSELEREISKINERTVQKFLLDRNCDWITFVPNPPKASHMGGIWERMIGVVRRVLEGMLVTHGDQLNDDGLHTLLVEVESIVNGRPLTYVDVTDPTEPVILTPALLLNYKLPGLRSPMGVFSKEDLWVRKRWRRVQYLSELFWGKWIKEYIPLLQERSKWQKEQPNLLPGDLVLMVEENVSRDKWPMGKVESAKISQDGLVRTVAVRTKDGIYDRPIRKLVLLQRFAKEP